MLGSIVGSRWDFVYEGTSFTAGLFCGELARASVDS